MTEAEKEEQRAALQRNANAAAFNNCADPDDPNCQLADENAALSESQQEALKNRATELQGGQSIAHVTAAENKPSEFDGPASQGTNIGVDSCTNFCFIIFFLFLAQSEEISLSSKFIYKKQK